MTIDKGGYQSSSLIKSFSPTQSGFGRGRLIREANQGNQDYISLDNCASRKLIGGCSSVTSITEYMFLPKSKFLLPKGQMETCKSRNRRLGVAI